jgi:hypothetical protein
MKKVFEAFGLQLIESAGVLQILYAADAPVFARRPRFATS